jgi:hypothetical protein
VTKSSHIESITVPFSTFSCPSPKFIVQLREWSRLEIYEIILVGVGAWQCGFERVTDRVITGIQREPFYKPRREIQRTTGRN